MFTLERVNKSPASFDVKKLSAFQDRYMQALPLEQKLDLALPYLVNSKLIANPISGDAREVVSQIVQAAGDRIKIAGDILDYSDFFVTDDQVPIDDKAFEKRKTSANPRRLGLCCEMSRRRSKQPAISVPTRWSTWCKTS